jgi:predicted HicB family RNase H-like nuclease
MEIIHEKTKLCAIRMAPDLHRVAKLAAYTNGVTLQEWLANLIKKELRIKELK